MRGVARWIAWLAAATAAGCSAPATSIELTVDGSGIVADQLRVTLSGAVTRQATRPLTGGLPITILLIVPDAQGDVVVDVAALAQGQVVAEAQSPAVALSPHHRAVATVDLVAPVDAAVPDLRVVAPCGSSTALFCEDFESGAIDPMRWTSKTVSGTAAVDGTHVHGGRYALHVQTSPADAGSTRIAELREHATLVTAPQTFVRAFVYAAAWPPAGMGHNAILSFRGPGGGLQIETYVGTPDINRYGGTGFYKMASGSLPTGQWVCLEWEIDSGASWSTTLSVDGTPTIAGSSIEPLAPASFDIGTNIAGTGGQGMIDLWFDDLVIDIAPIGCS